MELVKTNYGVISWDDYCEIMAWQYGYGSYDELLLDGLYIDFENGDVGYGEDDYEV